MNLHHLFSPFIIHVKNPTCRCISIGRTPSIYSVCKTKQNSVPSTTIEEKWHQPPLNISHCVPAVMDCFIAQDWRRVFLVIQAAWLKGWQCWPICRNTTVVQTEKSQRTIGWIEQHNLGAGSIQHRSTVWFLEIRQNIIKAHCVHCT